MGEDFDSASVTKFDFSGCRHLTTGDQYPDIPGFEIAELPDPDDESDMSPRAQRSRNARRCTVVTAADLLFTPTAR